MFNIEKKKKKKESIILSYQTSETQKIEIIEDPHGNTKKKDAPAYRPIQSLIHVGKTLRMQC